tara:strand:- start:180 stop:1826 length:1647 start_codon:yes stop_codon:yes gene_type:complete
MTTTHFNSGTIVESSWLNDVDAVVFGDGTGADSLQSNQVRFTPAGTGAVNRTVQAKLREQFSVLDFMTAAQVADVQAGTLAVDVTVPIQAAVDAATAAYLYLNTTGLTGRERASINAVVFPRGKYKVTATINCGRFTNLISDEGAYIEVSAGVTAFEWANCYINKVQGISFNAGAKHLRFVNANIDATRVEIDNCDFQMSTGYAIESDGGPQISGQLIVNDNCRFVQCAKVLYNVFDETRFGGWVEIDTVIGSDNPMAANSALFYNEVGMIHFYRMIGVPNVGTDGTRKANIRWIDNYSLGITADCCRFGGESAGMPIVYNFATPVGTPTWIGAQITITNSDLFCGTAGGTDTGVIVLGSGGYLPQNVCIQNCRGPSDGAWFNNKVAGTDLAAYLAAKLISDPNIRFTFTVAPNLNVGMVNLSTTVGTATDIDSCIRAGRYGVWVAPTLLNSWANSGGAGNTAGFMKDDSGFVHLRGILITGVIPNPMFTLPEGFRPAYTENLSVFTANAGPTPVVGWLQVTAAGSVIPQVGGTVQTCLDGVVFKAAL